ncbi:SRPBCC domain-containing protein [Spongiactinospora sp. TRM90649]|uniref:SRPBCC domain-containing protein n=1 Tax=Spongiactinospora sp. TRM90649 TaxID=3031114 RepID=UPI0023F6CCF5|nr:SRPBCC domain-containing protein [Spongiactinospora sp. TRM90649]MDF5759323.1 SRPBCC domain-containing protein [Spongiactinospora sp. TRM90649]
MTLGGRFGAAPAGASPDQGTGALWGFVSTLRPSRELVLDGSMGIRGPVVGQWRMTLEPDGDTTVVTVEHRVFGEVDEGTRAGFTGGWTRTLEALDAFAAGSGAAAGRS